MSGATDRDIAAWLSSVEGGGTYSELTAECRRQFGDAAWTADRIRAYVGTRLQVPRSRIERSAEIRAFLDDRLGLHSIDALTSMCSEQFGTRAPSRAAIGRYWAKVRRVGSAR